MSYIFEFINNGLLDQKIWINMLISEIFPHLHNNNTMYNNIWII